jgi:hypothetical protein
MPKWEEWVSFGGENGGGAFPQLEQLYIKECRELTGGLPVHLSSLSKLDIINCPQLVAPLPSIRELKLDNCNEMLLKELPTGMEKLVIEGFNALESLPKVMINSNGSLRELQICNCSSLMSLPNDGLPCNLQELKIDDCSSLMSLPNDGLPSALKTFKITYCKKLELSTHLYYSSLEKLCLWNCDSLKSFLLHLFPKLYHIEINWCSNLESLTVPEHYEHDLVTLEIEIWSCPNFVSFPKGGLRAPSLTSLSISDCDNLKSLPAKMHILLLSLETLIVWSCPEVESFPEGGLPSNLNSIEIIFCEKLIASRMGWGLQNLPFLKSFSIGGNNEDLESFPEAQLLPTSLTSLSIFYFPNLKCLDKKGLCEF